MNILRRNDGYVRNWIVLVMDMTLSLISSTAAILLIRALSQPIFRFMSYVGIWLILAAAGSLIGFMVVQSYKVVLRHATLNNIGQLTNAIIIKELMLLACVLLDFFNISEVNGGILLVIVDALLSLVTLILVRVGIIIAMEAKSDSIDLDINRLSVMVFGTSYKSVAMVTRLEFSPHYNVIGFVSNEKSAGGGVIANKKTYFANSEDSFMKLSVSLGGVDCILFARQEDADAQTDKMIKWCVDNGIHILVAPKVEEVDNNVVGKAASKELKRDDKYISDGMSSFERNVKRVVDFCLASLLIVVFSPLFLICWIAIKAGDKGPALYKQERIGRFGRPFNILKFRSMRMDAEKEGPALYAGDDDPRLTKVGKFLRQHHLDELPQLLNVWVGDMAFVGYRPERRFYIDQIEKVDPRYYYLFQIRPGVTSYATLHNGYTDTLDKMVRRLQYDLHYLQNRSWWFDIKILWLTFMNIVFGKKF